MLVVWRDLCLIDPLAHFNFSLHIFNCVTWWFMVMESSWLGISVLKPWLVDWNSMEDGHFDFWGWAQWIRIINWPIESRLTCVDSSMMAGIKSNKSTSWQDVKRGECWCWTGKTQAHKHFEMVKAKIQSNHSSLYSTCLSWLRMKAWQIWLCRCFTSLLSLSAFTIEL